MTTAYNWPPTLPAYPTRQYGESHGVNVLRTPVDAGPPKIRKTSNRPDIMTVAYRLTTAQVVTLETFVKTTIAGVRRFNYTHPRTAVSKETRFVPNKDGEYYQLAFIGPGLWLASMQLEILP